MKILNSIWFAAVQSALISFMLWGVAGCQSTKLDPAGVYRGDTALYASDLTAKTAYDALNAFVSWEYANRAALFVKNPEIKRAADRIRASAPEWFRRESALRAAYLAAPSAASLNSLNGVLAEIQSALALASQFLGTP